MEARKGGFRLPSDGAEVDVAGFPLLRNVSIHMRNADARLAKRFEEQLARQLATIRAEPSPMAMAMLLVATGMLIAPVTMVAQRAGEIVRILTGMLK
jgi:hypothetical protein